jgi:hypothetical protein
MARIVLAEVRLLDITWEEEGRRFVLRLLEGNRYVTPRLFLTPLNMLQLLRQESVTLGEWVRLGRDRYTMSVTHLKEGRLGPDTRWVDFYQIAERERGAKPELGWREFVGR